MKTNWRLVVIVFVVPILVLSSPLWAPRACGIVRPLLPKSVAKFIGKPMTTPTAIAPRPTAKAEESTGPKGYATPVATSTSVASVQNLSTYTVGADGYNPYALAAAARSNEINLAIRPYACGDYFNGISEEQRFTSLQKNEIQGYFCTLSTFLLNRVNGAKVSMIVGYSSGLDMIVAGPGITNTNDLRGKRIAAPNRSAGHFLALAALYTANIPVSDVQLVLTSDMDQAVNKFIAGEADAVAGWLPNIGRALDPAIGGQKILTSKDLRLIIDVFVYGPGAVRNQTKAFQRSWFEVLKNEQEHFSQVADAICGWRYKNLSIESWTGFPQERCAQELWNTLTDYGQASLPGNTVAFANPEWIKESMQVIARILQSGGLNVGGFNPDDLIDSSIVNELSTDLSLYPKEGRLPNGSFQPKVLDLPAKSVEELRSGRTVAELEFQIKFKPNSVMVEPESVANEEQKIQGLVDFIRASTGRILIEGSAAWLEDDTPETNMKWGLDRAEALKKILIQRGIPAERIATTYVHPPENERYLPKAENIPNLNERVRLESIKDKSRRDYVRVIFN